MLRVVKWLGMVVGGALLATGGSLLITGVASVQVAACPCTIFDNTTPAVASAADSNAVELGVRFQATGPGSITGLRFFKGPANTGTHVGHLWTNAGTPLATATFTAETASGWQEVALASPVAIAANTTYVASYFAPNGGYAVNTNYFTTGVVNGPLVALADGFDGPNGVFEYGPSGGFPTGTFSSANYWVDVVFQADQAPAFTSANTTTFTVASPGSFTVTATGFPSPALSLTSGTLPAGVTFAPATGVLSGTPAAGSGGAYPLSFTASNGVAPNATQSFTLVVNSPTTVSVTSSSNPSALGEAVTFTATVASPSGTPTGGTVQFKDGAANLGAPVPLVGGTASLTTTSLGVGTHPITAVYSGSGLFQPSSSAPINQTVSATLPCTQTFTGPVGPLTLGPGRWCISNAKVNGLTVQSGAAVTITNSQIVGPMTSTGAASLRICGSQISKGLNVSGSTGYVLIGDIASGCARNDVSGSLILQGNAGGVHVSDNRVAGSVTFDSNSGTGPLPGDTGPLLSANQIANALACASNTPAPTNNGRPNTVYGTRSGQCANPGF